MKILSKEERSVQKKEWLSWTNKERVQFLLDGNVDREEINESYRYMKGLCIPYKHPVELKDHFWGYGLKLDISHDRD